jgi:hypothetical protein
MTREERDLHGALVAGSDHLTAYNLYAEAFERCGYVGEVYGLPRHLFGADEIQSWAEHRGVLVKSIEDAALGMASVYRGVGLELPSRMPMARDHTMKKFAELLARYMPLDLVIDEETADGTEARVSKTSVCGSWGAIAGELRYFADRSGTPRAAIEGTQVPMHFIRRYATRGVSEIAYDARHKGGQLIIEKKLEYFGFELEREVEAVEEFPPEFAIRARRALAEAMAKGQARHASVKKNRASVEKIRETWRRSGGVTPRFRLSDLVAWYEQRLSGIASMNDFRNTRFTLDPDEIVPREVRERYGNLPDSVIIRDREIDVEYDVEEDDGKPTGVARLKLPEKLARNLAEDELPVLDRPLRFVVIRGQRGAIRAGTLDELQDHLDRPWSPDEVEESPYVPEELSRDERRARDLASRRRQDKRRQRHQGGGKSRRADNRGRSGSRSSAQGPRQDDDGRGRKRRGGPRRKFRGR